ncbi:MAG: molybdopterin cofactor-binding domain-containing protein [Myxococcota bacterium]
MTLSRRVFLKGLGVSAGGLLIGGGGKVWAQAAAGSFDPNVFVHIGTDGVVTIVCHRSEMGQGVRSTLPALIADELGADLASVRVVQAIGDKKYGDQNTDGSSSVRRRFDELREAGAVGRVMLCTAAARRWQVDAKTCTTEGGFVVHSQSKRRIAFADIVRDAARVKPPAKVELKAPAQRRYIGSSTLPLLDGPDIATGKAIFGADVKLPGLLTAVILHPPVVGGTLASYDATPALAIRGVRQVVELPAPQPPYKFQPLGGLAVIADNTWAALRGRKALVATWNHGDNAAYDSTSYREQQTATIRGNCTVVRSRGRTADAMSGAASRLEAEYFMPHLSHAPMEPPAATAHVKDGKCEVWTCTQNPQESQAVIAAVTGLPPADITVNVTLLGGGFGRKSKPDYVGEAAFLSQKVGAPVRVQWTREDDIRHDYFHTTSVQRLEAGLDGEGKLVAWRHRTTFPPIASTFTEGATLGREGELAQGYADFPLDIANVQVENGPSKAHVRIGWLRSVNNIHSAFGINCFIDELAAARKVDPKTQLLEILGAPRNVTLEELGMEKIPNYGHPLEDYPLDVARMRKVIERVTAMAGWEARAQDPDRGYGLAFHKSFQCQTAVVVAVKKQPSGKLKVDEVWLAADAGLVVNHERAQSQMEGAVLFGMSIAMYSEVTFKGGIAEQSNFDGYRLTRMPDAPRAIHIDIAKNEERPGGVGEPGVPPVAPAIVNAVFALTGKRVREVPLSRAGLV